ncbi:hypothetical protein F4778DRAFT_790702 [Xylariomycetidae sp. FL2044]|nr:hypothetical protein F4778DRAFT_790702 [Xylariomycetidae sp. FL2044]
MAILEHVPGFEVDILVDGQPVTEYDDPNQAAVAGLAARQKSPKYIESIDEAEYAIRTKVTPEFLWGEGARSALEVEVRIDDIIARHFCLHYMTVVEVITTEFETDDLGDGQHSVRRFKFAPVKTVGDDGTEREDADGRPANTRGQITVRVYRSIVVNQIAPTPESRSPSAATPKTLEKWTEGEAIVSSAKAHPVAASTLITDAIRLDHDDNPMAEYTFLYRSKDILMQELIKPRRPSSSTSTSRVGDWSRADVMRLAQERLDHKVQEMPFAKDVTRLARETLCRTLEHAPFTEAQRETGEEGEPGVEPESPELDELLDELLNDDLAMDDVPPPWSETPA